MIVGGAGSGVVVAERETQIALIGAGRGIAELERARLATAPERLDPANDRADPVGGGGGGLGDQHRLSRRRRPCLANGGRQADLDNSQASEHCADPRPQIAALAQVAAR